MCAINPTHKKRLILDVYTSFPMTRDEFESRVIKAALEVEVSLNSDINKLRCHIKETEQEAD